MTSRACSTSRTCWRTLIERSPRLANTLKRPADLKGPSLIRVAHSPDDWPSWLKAAGVPRLTARGPEFQFYGQALQAAAEDTGDLRRRGIQRAARYTWQATASQTWQVYATAA